MTTIRYDNDNSANLWAESAARCKYAVLDGQPLLGISGDEGVGHIVPLAAPAWFAAIDDTGQRDNVFRAMIAHATRVGQGKFKAEKNPTRDTAVAGALSAIDGTYTPAKSVVNDVIEAERDRRFAELVRGKVLAAKPTAGEADILATIAKQGESERGKALLAEFDAAVRSEMTYTPRRNKGKATGAIEVEI